MNKKIILAVVALVLVAVLIGGVWLMFGAPETQQGEKTIAVDVIMLDGTITTFDYSTDEEFLGPLLTAQELIDGEMGDYGIFVKTVNGVTVDDSKQQWWLLTKGGESVMTSFDQTPIVDGDKFELTLVEGY